MRSVSRIQLRSLSVTKVQATLSLEGPNDLRKGIDFVWLAFLVVIAELAIVITRFIFSYE